MNHSRKVLSASTLMGFEIVNIGGENLGHIDDVMIDLATGRVAYAILSFGGFLGLGDKLFAIPWSKQEPHPQKDKTFILDVLKEMLNKARDYDKNNWRDVSDPSWRQET
jgi:sporulation protein YlmC with PRC-barrel domain